MCSFIIHDDFSNSQTTNTLPNGLFTNPSLNSNSSKSGFEWISVLFRAIFPLNAWKDSSESQSISHWCSCIALGYKLPDFHWSTDLLTSTTPLWVMNYFDPMVTPKLKPSRLWSQAFLQFMQCLLKANTLKQGCII